VTVSVEVYPADGEAVAFMRQVDVAFEDVEIPLRVTGGGVRAWDAEDIAQLYEESVFVGPLRCTGSGPLIDEVSHFHAPTGPDVVS
jgi:hypothetical protein